MLVALGLPLTITLQRRATAELEREALIETQGIAAAIDPGDVEDPEKLQPILAQAAEQVGGRVIVVDQDGVLMADSDGPAERGTFFATSGRPEIRLALNGNPNSEIRDSQDLSEDIMATAVPIRNEDEIVGAVRVTRSVQHVNDHVRNVTLGLLAIGLAALFAGLLLAFGLARSLSRPLAGLAAAARRLGSGDLSARAQDIGGATEIEDLGRSFDDMAGRLERTVRAQREFVANASHQLRTPLTGMKLRIESAIAETEDEGARRQLVAAEHEVDRLSEIVDRLLSASRSIEEGKPTQVDLEDAVARAVARWSERADRLESRLVTRGVGGTAQGDPSDIDQILDNLIHNAISYAPGDVTIETGRRDGSAVLAVQDVGPGIPIEDLPRVTGRFYRGRGTPAGGSGLGLAIARDLARKWGGSLEVTSSSNEGTRVEVMLSLAAS
jgi:two-component system, OmpR family, sensor kinase